MDLPECQPGSNLKPRSGSWGLKHSMRKDCSLQGRFEVKGPHQVDGNLLRTGKRVSRLTRAGQYARGFVPGELLSWPFARCRPRQDLGISKRADLTAHLDLERSDHVESVAPGNTVGLEEHSRLQRQLEDCDVYTSCHSGPEDHQSTLQMAAGKRIPLLWIGCRLRAFRSVTSSRSTAETMPP